MFEVEEVPTSESGVAEGEVDFESRRTEFQLGLSLGICKTLIN